ncbi:BCCT family transporter [Candidatus Uabimicrobium sp. HlEnr_7]|uniref:BCCT family transporter n=1 Tax=Candidatus Uabimicrobium helgolandensis TaxID=3095367 RepID=UPI00355903F1
MKKNRYATSYKIGQDNVSGMGFDIHNPVFAIASLLVIGFVTGALAFPAEAKQFFDNTKLWSITYCDWLFSLTANFVVVFCLSLLILPIGKIKLGGQESEPEFSLLSWFSMLFAAGMGIGLMFWSVAEPVAYYTGWYGTPLNVAKLTPEAADLAMGATIFHWGLHPWAIYAVVGLSLAYFTFNRGMPLTIRSAFYPIFGKSAWGWLGNIVDIVAVLATIFGLATSLGFGAQQAGAGLHFLFDIPNTVTTQITIVCSVTLIAIFSVVRGLDGGVKVLSNINMSIAVLLFIFVVITGSTLAMINGFASTIYHYAVNILPLSNWIGREDEVFYHGWTIFYWAWWISWSPFVGMFIARISKGRTVRGFIIAVLLVPTIISVLWMTVFGGTGLEQVENNIGVLANGITDTSLTLFQMLSNLPLANITSFIAIVLVLVFFVTSSDSGSLVIDSITAGGKLEAPVPQRIFWASMEGLIAAVLLFGGGKDALGALQAATITTGLPFCFVLIIMCISLYMGLYDEYKVDKE